MKTSLSPGPLIVLCLARADAVESWKRLMGPENCSLAKLSAPTSLRALYGDPDDDTKNAVYGSDGDDDVQHELRFFFPNRKQPNMKMAFINRYYCSRCHLRPHPCVQLSRFRLLSLATTFAPSFINRWRMPFTRWQKLIPKNQWNGWPISCWSVTITSQWSANRTRNFWHTWRKLKRKKRSTASRSKSTIIHRNNVDVIWQRAAVLRHQQPIELGKKPQNLSSLETF